MRQSIAIVLAVCVLCLNVVSQAWGSKGESKRELRAGIIGLDTSHAPAFARILNDPNATADVSHRVSVCNCALVFAQGRYYLAPIRT